MHFDLTKIAQSDPCKLLVSTFVSRPIALTTTADPEGRVNTAPFSFFNVISSVTPISCWDLSRSSAGKP